MDIRNLLVAFAAVVLIAPAGCATDDAAKKDAQNAEPKIEKAGTDAKEAGEDAVDAVDDDDSK